MTVIFDHRDHHVAKVMAKAQLGPHIAVAACDPREERGGLWPVEQTAVLRAVNARRLEYQAGRFAARQAMEDLGVARIPIPSGTDRAPIWPTSLTGSISHCDKVCIAAVARTRDAIAIGIDVEPAAPLDDSLLDIICTPSERDWLAARSTANARVLAKLIFSAKESAFKAQYALSRQLFDFHGLSLDINVEGRAFSAVFQIDAGPFPRGYRLQGRCAISDGLIVTTAVLRPGALATAQQDPAR